MTISSEIEQLDAQRPAPPPILYKFVVPDRVEVLENASIRFTPPVNTNDIFEVRQTFDLIAGPKLVAFFRELEPEVDFEEPLRDALEELGLGFLSNEQAKALVQVQSGVDLEATTRGLLNQFLGRMPTLMNEPENVERLLDRMASGQLLLSLTERADSSPMWAHYANSSKGFVIAFDTSSGFFRRGDQGELQGLHKVKYFDGRVGEILDDPFAALISKQADWAYEREWRLYVKPDHIARVLNVDGDEIHLVNFPREAVQRVVLGTRASQALEDQLRSVLSASYPHAQLTRMHADRTTASLVELPVA